jgi:hypothetical protein
MLRREQVVGIVSSWDIRRSTRSGFSLLFFVGQESEGYSLLFTDTRVVGAQRSGFPEDFCVYLGPGSSASDELRAEGQKKAAEVIANEEFEMQKDKVVKVIYTKPRSYEGGRLLFLEVGRRVELKVTLVSLFNPGIVSTVDALERSLSAFVPDKLYDERIGRRVNSATGTKVPS